MFDRDAVRTTTERNEMLIKAAINGTRTRAEHHGVPLTAQEQAAEAAAAVAAGARAIHVHVRDSHGRETLAADDVARALEAIRASCHGIPVGVSTGAWIEPDASGRLTVVRSWKVRPDFASVNVHEQGALDLMRLLLDLGVGVEAGVWNAKAARTLRDSDLADQCLRVLIEPAEDAGDAMTNFNHIEATLGRLATPRLLHGLDASAWEFVALAAGRGYDTRTGFEDTLTLPDGSTAANNAALVVAANRIVASVVGR
jgi:uncharacterized protein (DUF849 family)